MNAIRERLQMIVGKFPGFEPDSLQLQPAMVSVQDVRDALTQIDKIPGLRGAINSLCDELTHALTVQVNEEEESRMRELVRQARVIASAP